MKHFSAVYSQQSEDEDAHKIIKPKQILYRKACNKLHGGMNSCRMFLLLELWSAMHICRWHIYWLRSRVKLALKFSCLKQKVIWWWLSQLKMNKKMLYCKINTMHMALLCQLYLQLSTFQKIKNNSRSILHKRDFLCSVERSVFIRYEWTNKYSISPPTTPPPQLPLKKIRMW